MGCQASSACSPAHFGIASSFISSNGTVCSGNFHDEFKLGKKLGEGAFGQVRLATSSDGGECAVKVLDFQRGILPQEAKEEVTSWRQASGHENVVELHQAFFDRSLGYIVLELCAGGSVMDMLASTLSAGEADLGRVFRGMLLGLARVHEVSVVHRDIKPENFLLGGPDNQTVKLADFGMAVCLKQGGTMCGVAGTAPYMSPEMLDSSAYGLGTDVWSMGVVAYLMLFGEFPYGPEARTSEQMKRAIVRGKSPQFSPSEADWGEPSTKAVSFVKRLMVRAAAKRPAAADALELSLVAPVAAVAEAPSQTPGRLSAQPVAVLARQATAQLKVRADPTVQRNLDELLLRLQGNCKVGAAGDRSRLCRSFSALEVGGGLDKGTDDDGGNESKPFLRPVLARSSTHEGSRDLTLSELAAAQNALREDDDDASSCSSDSVSNLSTASGGASFWDARSNACCSQPATMDSLPMPVMPPMPIDEDEPMDFPLTCPLRPLPTKAPTRRHSPVIP